MMERLISLEVGRCGGVVEEIETICCMTGFRRRFLVRHLVDGWFYSVELEAS